MCCEVDGVAIWMRSRRTRSLDGSFAGVLGHTLQPFLAGRSSKTRGTLLLRCFAGIGIWQAPRTFRASSYFAGQTHRFHVRAPSATTTSRYLQREKGRHACPPLRLDEPDAPSPLHQEQDEELARRGRAVSRRQISGVGRGPRERQPHRLRIVARSPPLQADRGRTMTRLR